ncbi:probable UDP-N-acetylglucosamine--peptide N-acetylglucosaminyltransferase SEC [Zingiber officinale]|uniref:probable UDP-N-acetylglucosamine--peptide N-acetylglucosaminyltransferase SEC n=1 Tax=Zingiber officinale TaxID=94328 RepID=UPI001C4CDEF6|nr:probable UDP-N-acetylglucosamine--peptide N-acetylglucosaminyltransferase SEC [Zingiber officinale]
MDCNMMSVAASFYKATLAVTAGISAPFNNLAIIYKQQILGSTYIATLLVQPLLPAWIFNHENCCFLLVQTDADGLVNRGNTFKEIGRVTEAIQDYIRAVNIRPTMPEAHANLASAYKDSLQISSIPELKLMKCGSSGSNPILLTLNSSSKQPFTDSNQQL